jgi:hypothetical protein
MIDHILKSCGVGALDAPTIIFAKNAACVAQMESCYIKCTLTGHLIPMSYNRMGDRDSANYVM